MRDKLIAEKRRIESVINSAPKEERDKLKLDLEKVELLLSKTKKADTAWKAANRDTSNDVLLQILAELREIRKTLSENNN